MNKKEIDTVDICEVTSIITEEICFGRSIQLNKEQDSDDCELVYTDKAQDIFNRYFDLLDNTFRK